MSFPFDVKEMWYKAFRQSASNTKIAVTNEEETLGLIVDQVDSVTIYIGEGLFSALTSEAKWKIKKIDLSNGVRITAASNEFNQIWDNRASLTYV